MIKDYIYGEKEVTWWGIMKEVLWKTKFSLLYILLAMAVLYYGTYHHELVHQKILEGYDTESKIELYWSGAGATYYDSTNCTELCQMSHMINEAVGYNIGDIKMIMAMGFFFIIMFLEHLYNLKEEELIEKYLKEAVSDYST